MGCPSTGCTGYELANNLDYGTQLSAQGWLPIGYYNSEDDPAAFTATFDGGGYTISNLRIIRANYSYVGLFALSGAESVIRRVGLPSVNIVGYRPTGGLVGGNGGAISDSYVTGTVTGRNHVGGLAGWNAGGTITNSYTTGTVTGKGDNVGGLTGWSNKAIAHSHSDASVTGSRDWVGGLVGENTDTGTISASYATGNVSGPGRTGGLVGVNGGIIIASYATGDASSTGGDKSRASGDVGGLAGYNGGTVTASYATGSVYSAGGWCSDFSFSVCMWYGERDDGAGGLVGDNQGTITMSYATGWVSGAGRTSVGGLTGQTSGSGTASLSYWDTQTTGQTRSSGGVGRPTVQLQSPTGNTGIYATWNPNWWDFGTASQYPVLKVDGLSVAAQRGTTPTNLTATPGPNPGEVTLSWRSDAHAPAYVVFWQKEDGDGWYSVTIPGDASGYTMTNLEPGQEYLFAVAAIGSWGWGPWSPTVSAVAAQAGSVSAVTDRAALVAFYEATGGANWTNQTNWLSDKPLGNWHGVATNVGGRVTALELDYNTLSGSIPAELGNLDQLTIFAHGQQPTDRPHPDLLGQPVQPVNPGSGEQPIDREHTAGVGQPLRPHPGQYVEQPTLRPDTLGIRQPAQAHQVEPGQQPTFRLHTGLPGQPVQLRVPGLAAQPTKRPDTRHAGRPN